MTTMPIDNHAFTQRRLQFIGIGVNKLTLKRIDMIQSSNNYNIVSNFICNCSMFCCTLLYVHSSFAIILMGKRELVALLNFSSWCLVMVEWLFLLVPRGCLRFVIVVFPDQIHLLFFICWNQNIVHIKILDTSFKMMKRRFRW